MSGFSNRFRLAVGERIFVNCPFSESRRTLFDAIVFALHCCRMTPIIAPHRKGDGQSRLDFILRQLRTECRFSIHDITPVGGVNFRYNMAFELGLCLGAGHGENCLIFADNRRAIGDRFSDLGGLDISEHRGKSEIIARKVALWLAKYPSLELPAPAKVESAFLKFRAPFAKECKEYGWKTGDDLSVRVKLINGWILEHPPQ